MKPFSPPGLIPASIYFTGLMSYCQLVLGKKFFGPGDFVLDPLTFWLTDGPEF